MVDQVVLVERDGGVATIRLDRPPVNALNGVIRAQLVTAAHRVSSNPAVKAVVVTGGDNVFASGADIKELAATSLTEMSAKAAELQEGLGVAATIPKPTVAAIEGFAFGGGLEIAMAADWRIAAENARLGLPEVTLGLIPGGGGVPRMVRLIGLSRAKELLMTGRHVGAEEALHIGLVDEVVPSGQAHQASVHWARRFERAAPLAVAAAKAAADGAASGDLEIGLRLERALFLSVFATDDSRAGIQSFLECGPGKATFSGC